MTAAGALGEDANVVATLDFVHARVALDLGRVEQARGLAARGLQRAREHGIVPSAEQGMLAAVALWSPGESGGLSGAAVEFVVRRLLALGRRAGLLSADPEPEVPHGDILLARLDLMVAQGEFEAVRAMAQAELRTAREQERQRDAVEILLVLAKALAAAAPGRLLSPFLRQRSLLAAHAADLDSRRPGLAQAGESVFLERLRGVLGLADAPAASAPAEPVSPPSAREVELLALLALLDLGLSNQQLADRLTLSVTTIKWHLRNLCSKLGVSSRSAALAKARACNLLPR